MIYSLNDKILVFLKQLIPDLQNIFVLFLVTNHRANIRIAYFEYVYILNFERSFHVFGEL